MMHRGTQEIETDRLILRKFKLSDAEGVYNSWATDSKCNKFLKWENHVDINETISTIEKWIDEYMYGSYNWIVELKDSHEVIGMIDAENVYDRYNSVELGFVYASKYWGNGYATEALKAVIAYFFNECEIHLIECHHTKSNVVCGKVLEKSGMKQEAILKDRRVNKITGEYEDLIIYSIFNDK